MKLKAKLNIKHWKAALNAMIAIGVFTLIIIFINFNSVVANNAKDTRAISANTNKTVKSQGDILDAIQQLAIDNKTTSDQKTDIIICMLQVPVSQRTTDTVTQCKKQVEQGESSAKPQSSNTQSSIPSTPIASTSQPAAQAEAAPAGFVQTTLNGATILVDQTQDFIKSLFRR